MADEPSIAALVARYAPAVAADLQAARAHLASLVPRGFELVYDNYNALAFGFCPSLRASEAVVSVAAYPRWVTLFFLQGVSLDDPGRVLQGTGSRVRSVRLQPFGRLHAPEIASLLEQALARHAAAFGAAPPLSTVLKSVSDKQRPRRPSST
jgi:hypothetical protein